MWNPPGILTTADSVRAACRAITDADPRVCGSGADNVTSALRDSVLRRWELMKLLEYLPGGVMQRLSGLDPDTFSRRQPQVVAKFLFARSHSVELSAIRKGRLALRRLLIYLVEHEIPWEGEFGHLSEIDLFSFLIEVHENAVAKGTDTRPGLTAAWSVLEGLAYLKTHFGLDLPTDSVRKVLPKRGHKRGAAAILTGALPLPPEALEDIIRYLCHPDTPPVMVNWSFALAFFGPLSAQASQRSAHLLLGRARSARPAIPGVPACQRQVPRQVSIACGHTPA